MSSAKALLVGLNQVNPDAYNGWTGESGCWGCENDVDNVADMLRPLRYQIETLKTSEATAENILNALNAAASQLVNGDIFVFHFSGHGGQQPSLNGDELDGQDETLVAYDREIVDDELDQIWLKMKPGVRIVMLSDSCNSGTNYRRRGTFGRPSPFIPITKPAIRQNMKAQLIHMGGCRDGFSSMGYQEGGAFTIAVCECWQNGSFQGNYNDFYSKVFKKLEQDSNTPQQPQYNEYGPISTDFKDQTPFTIGNPQLNLAQSVGIHGNNIKIEYPNNIVSVEHKGCCVRIIGEPCSHNWFHFAIPTPVLIGGDNLCGGSVFLRYQTGDSVSIDAVHIYDGENKITSHDHLDLSSFERWSTPKFEIQATPTIRWGIGIT
jgi:hypothetical protein